MRALISQLCALSLFCAVALSLTPEGSVKKAAGLCCALVLLLPLVTAVRDFDYGVYSLELARYRAMGAQLADEAEASRERLDRLAVERACARHIEDCASALGIEARAEVTARWSTGGFWLPERITITGRLDEAQRAALSERITAELGLGPESQDWEGEEDGSAAK